MLEIAQKKDFEAIFSLMEKSFPKDEYRTREEQLALFDRPRYRVYLYRAEEDGAICGFAAVWTLGEVCFLEHLAVDPCIRNRGIGANILRELLTLYGGRVCLEVELPETDMAIRRIGFYERLGFTLNRYPYLQPAMSRGQNAVPLWIMTSWGSIGAEEFEALRDLLYDQVYGCRG